MQFVIGLVVGMGVGSIVGVFAISLAVAAKEEPTIPSHDIQATANRSKSDESQKSASEQ